MKAPRTLVLLLIVGAAALPSCRGGAETPAATIAEKAEMFKTYPFGEPDPVPIYARTPLWAEGARLYPYHAFTHFSERGANQDWKVVRLENDFISVGVLPQVGGKVWGATEKSTGRDFLYANHVLKFREIALRGPWTSGGIEFNFGVVGHAPTTATPVDYVLRQDADGGVSCIVGAMDLPSRTRWSVRIRLPKDKAYFETDGTWTNPTPFSQSYYYWSCGAIKTADDLRYIFPGRREIGHNYDAPPGAWPVDAQGRDLSWYRNNAFGGSKSYFTYGERADFYGAWYEKADAGFGHWALYDDMPGRKVWIWDQSRAGGIWVDLLTDADGQYTEPQAGRLLNQTDHEFLRSGATDRWRELWFPYRGIGAMVQASPAGALHAAAAGGSLSVGLFPLEAFDGDLVVESGGREIHREHLKLPAAEPWKKVLPLDLAGAAFTVRAGESLVYRSDPRADEIGRPLAFKPVDETTAEGLFRSGARLEKGRFFDTALEKYLACLKREPTHLRALVRTAELYARRGQPDEGRAFAERALAEEMYEPSASYIAGVIARRLGRLTDAKETLGWAARSTEFRTGAYVQLAEIALLENAPSLAVEYAQRAVDAGSFNSSAYEVLASALRRQGQPAAARDVLERLLELDPLDHLARFELYLLDKSPKSLETFKSMLRGESVMQQEIYLEAALFYIRTGARADALALLRQAPDHPTVHYWQAYLMKDTARAESLMALERAAGLSPRLVFPYREEEIPLYEWAAAARPAEWKPKYYLGLILWGKGRRDEARALFDQCRDADFAPFYMTRGMMRRETDPAGALTDYRRAVHLEGKSWFTWHALTGFLAARGTPAEALETARQAKELFPNHAVIQVDLVKALMKTGAYGEAAEILDGINALPFEGAGEIQGLFAETHFALGLAAAARGDWAGAAGALERSKEYPERLGTGRPFDPEERAADFLLGLVYRKQGRKEMSAAAFQAVVDATRKGAGRDGVGAYCGALALRRAGFEAEARELLRTAAQPGPALRRALAALQ